MALIELKITADEIEIGNVLQKLAHVYQVQQRVCEPVNPVNKAGVAPSNTPLGRLVPDFTEANVLAFLRSNPEYKYRTVDAVAKYFDQDIIDAENMLLDMEDDGKVIEETRRSDNAALYAAAPVQPTTSDAPAQVQTTGVTDDAVVSFLRGDSRYEYRSASAVANHFGINMDVVFGILDRLVDSCKVRTITRRSDGVVLYGAN